MIGQRSRQRPEHKNDVRLQSKSIEAVRSLVALGQGVTILSDLVYRPWSLEGNRISRRDLSIAVPTMDVGAVWQRKGAMSAPSRTLLDLFRSWKKRANQACLALPS
jgi:DNA-binding transcriptional LysR family regulator